MFNWYATYIKAYELLLQTDKIAVVSKKKIEEIRKLLEDCKDEADIAVIIEKLG